MGGGRAELTWIATVCPGYSPVVVGDALMLTAQRNQKSYKAPLYFFLIKTAS